MSDRATRQSFVNFIADAERFGLPVGMLRDVADSDYTYELGGSTNVSPWFNALTFEPADLASVADMSLSKPRKEAGGVQTIYHEATHAWFDVKKDAADVRVLREQGREYYKDAPLGQGRADDPDRIFDEAIASYVGHRTSIYWQALEELTIISDTLTTKPAPHAQARILVHAKSVRATYERQMGERVFGYQTPGWWSSKQLYTTRIVSSHIKTFADKRLLENRLPDQFARTGAPKAIWDRLALAHYPALGK